MKEKPGVLREIPIFAKLDDDELKSIENIGSVRNYPKGGLIFLEGAVFTGFYVILSGSVKVYKLSEEGLETVLHILKPYRSFAETPIMTGAGVYPACAEAIEDSTLFFVPASDFRKIIEKSTSISIKISESFALRLMELNKKFGQLSASVESKLARHVIAETTTNGSAGKTEPYFELNMSKKDLAAQLGIAVETLSRALRKMKDQKIIRESSRKIFVLDMKRLRELSR